MANESNPPISPANPHAGTEALQPVCPHCGMDPAQVNCAIVTEPNSGNSIATFFCANRDCRRIHTVHVIIHQEPSRIIQ